MNTNNQHIEYHHKSAFVSKEDKGTLVKALWLILKTCFYPGITYSAKEQRAIYRVLGILFHHTTSPYETYVALCESSMLIADYCRGCRPGIAIIHLLGWLGQADPKLAKDSPLKYSTLVLQRQNNRLLHIEWKYLADAVLGCMENAPANDAAYWIKWFAGNHCTYELQVYLGVIRECAAKNSMP